MPKNKLLDIGDELDYLYDNGVDLKNRIVYITDHSGEESEDSCTKSNEKSLNYNNAVKSLFYLSSLSKHDPIKILINSFGGDVYEALSLFDVIKLLPNKTIGLGVGLIASAASLVLAACEERYLTLNSFIMIHELSSNLDGKHADQKNEVIHQEQILSNMYVIYSSVMNNKLEQIKEMLRKDCYITPSEALKIGFINKIIHDKKEFMKII